MSVSTMKRFAVVAGTGSAANPVIDNAATEAYITVTEIAQLAVEVPGLASDGARVGYTGGGPAALAGARLGGFDG